MRNLQAAQLNDALAGFVMDVATIVRSMSVLAADLAAMVEQGRSLCGLQDKEMMSFLAAMKQRLGTALSLIAACGCAKMAVDESIAALETMLAKFRSAISSLGHTITDITLIGMNAGLKASHLGVRGRAFVVIANELKATADRISAGEKLLGPAVDRIELTAAQLKNLRKDEQALQVAELETLDRSGAEQHRGGQRTSGAADGRSLRRKRAFRNAGRQRQGRDGGPRCEILDAGAGGDAAGRTAAEAGIPCPATRRERWTDCSTICSRATPWTRNATRIAASPPAIRS